MRILGLTRYARLGASSRVRFYQYLPHLRAAGLDVQVQPLFHDAYLLDLYAKRPIALLPLVVAYARRLLQVLRAGGVNRLWIEYELLPWLPAVLERLLARQHIPYIVDYDDAVFHRYDVHPLRLVRAVLGRKIDIVMRSAALVTAGNRYIADRARQAGAAHVVLLPSVVDAERYRPSGPEMRGSSFVIGWIGSPSTVRYVNTVIPALRTVCQGGRACLRLIGASLGNDVGLRVDTRPWIEDREVDEVAAFDVGIMPLIDGPWERGKCGYKLIQYMACGRPVVASPIGANLDIIRNGECGFFASTQADWIEALETLRLDAQLRRRMGQAGRRRVVDEYSVQIWAPKLAALLRGA